MDVYLHGSVHLTNPGLEELLADTLSQGMSRSLLGPRGPADTLVSLHTHNTIVRRVFARRVTREVVEALRAFVERRR